MNLDQMKEYINGTAPIIYNELMNNTLAVIVGCTKRKIWDTKYSELAINKELEAVNVYKGPLFHQFLNFRQLCVVHGIPLYWKILSAKYGIINPTKYISDYNVSFVSKYGAITNPYVRDSEIFDMVDYLFKTEFCGMNTLLIWAGREYVVRIQNALSKTYKKDIKVFAPAYGLKIGESLQMMKNFNLCIGELMDENKTTN